MAAARFRVAGKVQGVRFRASARTQALRLGLGGYAKNLDDGRVEVVAVGDDGPIEALAHWLERGPPMARVDRVEREDIDAAPDTRFEIR